MDHVLHVLVTPFGGSALSTIELIGGLANAGVRSSVVCMDIGTDAERDLIEEAVEGRVAFLPLYRWRRRLRTAWPRRMLTATGQSVVTAMGRRSTAHVRAFAERERVSLVHSTAPQVPEGRDTARALGLPHVWHIRELVGPGEPFRFYGETSFYPRRVRPATSAFIANSRTAADRFASLVPVPIEVIYNGMDLRPLAALPPAPAAADGTLTVGMVAHTNNPIKLHEVFIRAAALAAPSVDARFVVVGRYDPDLPYTRGLVQLIDELGLVDRFRFAGEQPTVPSLAGFDVLVHTAEAESCPRVVAEAMAAARPVVGVWSGGVGELVDDGETGLLAEPGDARGVADRIVELVRQPVLRTRLGARGRVVALERHSVETMTNSVLAVYERAAALVRAGGSTASNGRSDQ